MPEAIVATAPDAKTVLVLGAGGFLGGFIVAALRRAGFRVLRGVRETRGAADAIACDLQQWTEPAQWAPVLVGVDAVVNAAGILRERHGQRFDAIHERAPLALAQAGVDQGVRRFVQISALGDPRDGEFVASKHRCDAALLALPLDVLVLRPSVVYSASGAYGGTALLRAIAAAPLLLPLPAGGAQRFSPLAAEDLAELVVAAIDGGQCGMYEVVGPEALTLRDYLARWRRWLGFPEARVVAVPGALVSAAVACGDAFGRGPLTGVIWRMLQRGNVGAADAQARLRARLRHRAARARRAAGDAAGAVAGPLAGAAASAGAGVADHGRGLVCALGLGRSCDRCGADRTHGRGLAARRIATGGCWRESPPQLMPCSRWHC